MLSYSDASLKNGVATYAWVVGGLQGGDEERGRGQLSGGGRVHGHPKRLSLTRAEHVGVLSALTSLAQWPELRNAFDGHVHYCDNKGVSDRMDHEEWQESAVFGPNDWARANDPDVHAEAEAQRSLLGMSTVVRWHRGHPERRLCKAAWSRHDRAIYKVDKLADEVYKILPVLQTG